MKRIDEIDPNFRLNAVIPSDTLFYDPYEAPFSLWGLVPNAEKSYCRLPLEFLKECSESVRSLAWHLAGACVRVSTDASALSVLWTLRDTGVMPHITACGQSGLELFEETDCGTRQVKNLIPETDKGCGCLTNQRAHFPLPGGMRHYALYLPLYNGLKELLVGVSPDATIQAGREPRFRKPIVFYGSSITQGGCAGKVGSCYSTILARRLDAAQINLGFSGSARGEESMARYIASLEMSAFVLDYDHNAPTVEHLAATHEPFFKIIREAQPELPVLLVSKPDFDSNPEANALRRSVIARTWAHALEAGDRKVWFVDGEQFFGHADRDLCSVDGCHPTDIGFLRMADVIEPILRRALNA